MKREQERDQRTIRHLFLCFLTSSGVYRSNNKLFMFVTISLNNKLGRSAVDTQFEDPRICCLDDNTHTHILTQHNVEPKTF
jgi:hypothetical protein